tara:strand:- start:1046 stop:2176 length:1131 start_codon:yes stop_codon:yes gene_type:complete
MSSGKNKQKKNDLFCKSVLLLVNGNIKDINIPLINSNSKQKNVTKNVTKNIKFNQISITADLFENIEDTEIENIGEWELNSTESIIAYGYTKGIHENNHELLPLDNIISKTSKYYGDILLLKIDSSRNIININSNNYEEIYTSCYTSINESDSEIDYDEDVENEIDEEYQTTDEETDNSEDEDVIIETETGIEVDIIPIQSNKTDVKIMNSIRQQIQDLFNTILKSKDAINLENSIVDYTLKIAKERNIVYSWDNEFFKKIYLNKARSIFSNIKTDTYIKNTYLMKNIKKNKLNIEDLPTMTFQEIFPEHWKKIMDEKHNRDKFLYENETEAMTDQFKCGRCKSRECSYYELQTRSADESMTTFITCIKCGHRWRQ